MIEMITPPATAPIGLYVHVPFCLKKCDYCSFYSQSGRLPEAPAFIAALEKEIEATSRQYGPLVADTIYFGGGTPSLLETPLLEKALKSLRRSFVLTEDCEVTLEANPCTVDPLKASAWVEMRVSSGQG